MAGSPSVETDPFTSTAPTGERLIRWSAWLALAWSCGYLAYRATSTLGGVAPIAGTLFFVAEVLGVVVFALRVRSASATPLGDADLVDAPRPSVTAVIDATGASIDELRTTLVACRRLAGLDRTIVVDTGGSRWLRTTVERFDAIVFDPDVDVGTALCEADSPWVLVLEAGDVPLPDLLQHAAAVCSSPDVGIVQVGAEEADPSSYEHDPGGRWSLNPFQNQVVRPSLAARGSIPWYGDGPALVRPDAVRGAADRSSTVTLGIHAIETGYRVTMIPRTLARVQGPRTLGESLALRRRMNRPLQAAASGRLGRLPTAAKIAHRVAVIAPLSALQRVVLVVSAVVVMAFGQAPINASFHDLLVIGAPAYLLRWNAQLLLGRGRLGPFSILRAELRAIGVDLPFGGNGDEDDRRDRLTVLAGSIVALDAAVFLAVVAIWQDSTHRLSGGTAAVTLLMVGGFLAVTTEVLVDGLLRRPRRLNHRVRFGLVTCRLEEREGRLTDLSTGGAGVVLDAPPSALPEPGTVTTVSFRIPDAEGAWRNVSALVHVAHVASEGPEATRVGLSFDDPTDAPLDPVVEFLTIDRRLVSLGRRVVDPIGV